MECSEKLIWKTKTKNELEQIRIEPPEERIRKRVQENWDSIAKPLDGMGRFEKQIAQIGAITRTENIVLAKKAVLMFCADNGIVEEGISQSGQEVTAAVAYSMGKGQSSVCRMAKVAGADTIPIDIGINSIEEIPGVLKRKIRKGTRNFRKEPALTEQETIQGIATGILSLQTIVDVQRVAIGGGVSKQPLLMESLHKQLHSMYDPYSAFLPETLPEVVPCTFGNDANMIGALYHYLYEVKH